MYKKVRQKTLSTKFRTFVSSTTQSIKPNLHILNHGCLLALKLTPHILLVNDRRLRPELLSQRHLHVQNRCFIDLWFLWLLWLFWWLIRIQYPVLTFCKHAKAYVLFCGFLLFLGRDFSLYEPMTHPRLLNIILLFDLILPSLEKPLVTRHTPTFLILMLIVRFKMLWKLLTDLLVDTLERSFLFLNDLFILFHELHYHMLLLVHCTRVIEILHRVKLRLVLLELGSALVKRCVLTVSIRALGKQHLVIHRVMLLIMKWLKLMLLVDYLLLYLVDGVKRRKRLQLREGKVFFEWFERKFGVFVFVLSLSGSTELIGAKGVWSVGVG